MSVSRTYQRSFRLDHDLEAYMRGLPGGSGNSLVNILLMRFFTDSDFQTEILGMLRDERFRDWQPLLHQDEYTAPEPKKEVPDIFNKYS